MNDIKRAISDISDIRSQLAASTRFRGYAPELVASLGFASAAVLIAQTLWPDRLAASTYQVVLIWGGVQLASAITSTVEAIARTQKQHGGMAWAMLRGAGLLSWPTGFTGIMIGIAVLVYRPEVAWILPGIWLMLAGVVCFASFSTLPRRVLFGGVWFVVSGAIVCLLSARSGEVTPFMAGFPLVVGFLWIARALQKEGVHDE